MAKIAPPFHPFEVGDLVNVSCGRWPMVQRIVATWGSPESYAFMIEGESQPRGGRGLRHANDAEIAAYERTSTRPGRSTRRAVRRKPIA